MEVVVIKGGRSPEAEISRKTARSVAEAIERLGHRVHVLEFDDNVTEKLVSIKPDVVFVALHGSPGEDGTVQGWLEVLGIKYTGCNVETSAVCMDKDIVKRVLRTYGIPVPSGETFFSIHECRWFEFPCVVKPARCGSTLGVSIVRRQDDFMGAVKEAFSYDSKVIVEEFIDGREITVPVLNGKVLPPVEVIAEGGFYDYDAKYTSTTTEYVVPANISDALMKKLVAFSKRIFEVLECRAAIRIDFRISKTGIPYVLEINTIPGMTERSLLPKSALAAGISYEELIREILES